MVISIFRLSVSIHQKSYQHYQSHDYPTSKTDYCDYKKPTVSVLFAVVHFPFLKSPEPIQEQGHIFNHQNNLRFQKPLPLYSIRDQTEIIENKFKSLQLSSL